MVVNVNGKVSAVVVVVIVKSEEVYGIWKQSAICLPQRVGDSPLVN
jgi:hypothetical protein